MSGYPKWFSARVISLTVLALFITGVLLTPTALEMRLDWEVPWRLRGDHRVIVAAVHALFSFMMIAIIGALSTTHMRAGLRQQRNHRNGIVMVVIFVLLVVTGVGIYYFGDDLLASISSISHLLMGGLIAVLYCWHLLAYRLRA